MQIAPPDFDRMFGALADSTRRDIVRRAIGGEEGVAELAEHYPMSFAAVQKHVAILERAGLVTKERIGRRKVVRTNLEGLRVARRLLDQYEELWRGRIGRMADARRRGHGRSQTDDRDRRPQGSRDPDPDPGRGVRRLARPRVAAVVRPAPARALVGAADAIPPRDRRTTYAPGGRVEYHMTGPEGDTPAGYWEITRWSPRIGSSFRDGFADADGRPNTDMPVKR